MVIVVIVGNQGDYPIDPNLVVWDTISILVYYDEIFCKFM